MEINLKNTLRDLRRRKNITQENLANYLGITQQSVGKWERGEGFPDITLLPKLACYFGVSIDELLGVGQAQIDRAVQAYKEESLRLKNAGEKEKNRALWEGAYAEFPNDCRVMEELMFAIEQSAGWPCTQKDAEQIILLGERLLEEAAETGLRERAVQALCHTFKSLGEDENALRYADMGGSIYTTREGLRAFVLEGDAGVEASQRYIVSLLHCAAMAAGDMTSKAALSADEEIKMFEFAIDLLKLLFSDGCTGFYANDISLYYSNIARRYAEKKEPSKTLEALERSAAYAVEAAGAETEPLRYTAPMVSRLTYDPAATVKNYRGNTCDLRLDSLGWEGYDFIRQDRRFHQLKGELERHAECKAAGANT